MANPSQISPEYSVTVGPSNPETPSHQPEKSLIPPPVSSAPPRFPPPRLQQDHMTSPLIKTPNLLSPANGVKTGSPIPHLSTPLGPPVFTSPVRPAAVPFRTSPATPQPVALSSGSSLPTSSPAHFSNGSAELQHQVPGAVEETMPVGELPCVLFSAHKVLKQKRQANVPSLGFGALVSPGREVSQVPQIIQRDPHRCHNCGSYANIYCKILLGSGQWQCVICRNLNGSEGEYVAPSKEELCNFPELSSPVVEYVQTGKNRSNYVPVSDSRMSAPIVLVIDECLDEPHLQHLQSSLHAFVESIPPTVRIGIILYGRTLSVYDFSEDSIASSDVLPGDKAPTEESLKALLYGTGVYLSPMHASKQVAHDIFSSLRPYKLNIPEASRDRCLGPAVEVALAIIQGPSAEMSRGVVKRAGGNSRIIVCAGGPNTYGPGSVPHSFRHPNYPHMEKTALKWMELLGQKAHQHNTVIDILSAGNCPVRVPVLQPLAKASGGVLVLHDDFGEAFGVNLQRASTRAAGSHGLLEIRCSDDILVTQVVGPGEEAHVDSHETFKNDAALSIQMPSVEETQSFAVSMESKRDIKSDHVFFQFTIKYSNVYQADISRVVTVRLPTVDSVSAYLESVQVEVAAVLIAKRTLLRAKTFSEAIDLRTMIDERIKDIALKFGSQVPKSKLYRFPKELSALPELLFHLRRGPLLGSIIGHDDERSVLRNLFLNASFDLSLRMVAPRCLMHHEGGTFEELPAYDLAMQSDKAVVLDHGTDVFIWLGAELAADEGRSAAALAACRTLAEELSEFRFPAPRILAFKEGSSPARYFVSRLIPAHKDPPYEQEARFPQLRSLTPDERTKLKSSFLFFDDPSFCEWMRSLKVVPPEPRSSSQCLGRGEKHQLFTELRNCLDIVEPLEGKPLDEVVEGAKSTATTLRRVIFSPLFSEFFSDNGPIDMMDEDAISNLSVHVKLSLTVWDFILPATPSLPAVIGISDTVIEDRFGVRHGSDDWYEALDHHYKWLLQYRISPYFCRWGESMRVLTYTCPWPADHPKSDEYFSDPRLAAYAVPYRPVLSSNDGAKDHVQKEVELLRTKAHWKKAYFYLWDEPLNMEHYSSVRSMASELHAYAPDARVLTTYYCGPSDAPLAATPFESFVKVPKFLRPHTQIYCTSEWVLGNREDLVKDIVTELHPENGEEWWTYVCMGPSDPHPNWHLGMRGTQHRAVMWRVWKEGGTGFLYWGANCYEKATVPSAEIRFRRGLPPGDGVLFYPGEVFSSSHQPVASLRLERILSSLQDIEYLNLYASRYGRDEGLALLEKTGMYLGPERYTIEHMPIDVMRGEIFNTCRH